MTTNTDAPDWAWTLLNAVEQYEDEHPQPYTPGDCLGDALATVPAEARTFAAGIRHGERAAVSLRLVAENPESDSKPKSDLELIIDQDDLPLGHVIGCEGTGFGEPERITIDGRRVGTVLAWLGNGRIHVRADRPEHAAILRNTPRNGDAR